MRKLMPVICLIMCLSSVRAAEFWRTSSSHGKVLNYCFGQHDIVLVNDQEFIGAIGEQSPFNTACAAMATAAIAVLGNWFKESDITRDSDAELALLLKQVLHMGAKAYTCTPRDAAGFAEAGTVANYLTDSEHLPVEFDGNTTFACEQRMYDLHSTSQYTPERQIRDVAQRLMNKVERERFSVAGAVLSDGHSSRALLYLHPDHVRTGTFVLYDSHATFSPDFQSRLAEAGPRLSPAAVRALTATDELALMNQSMILRGSFLGIVPTIDALIALARADGRWWLDSAPNSRPNGISTVFMVVGSPRLGVPAAIQTNELWSWFDTVTYIGLPVTVIAAILYVLTHRK